MRIPHNEPLGSDSSQAGLAENASPGKRGLVGSAKVEPERKCVLTGQNGARDTLIRLAISPDGHVLPDVMARAPGRGAWVGVTSAELQAAIAKGKLKGALARAFKGAALHIPDDLASLIETALRRSFADRLGLEMRSGKLLSGSDRIAERARAGLVTWLAHASDAGEDGSRKLDQAWRVGSEAEGSGLQGIRLPLDRAALSVAIGRDNVVHLALTDQLAAKRVSAQLSKLLNFLGEVTEKINNQAAASLPLAERHSDY